MTPLVEAATALAFFAVAIAALALAATHRRDSTHRRNLHAWTVTPESWIGHVSDHGRRLDVHERQIMDLRARLAALEGHQATPLPPQRPASVPSGLHDAHRARTALDEWVTTVRMPHAALQELTA